MEHENFKEGDLVQLKAGGPKMTIGYIYQDSDSATCNWFDDNQTPQSFNFYLNSLKKSEI